MWRHRAALLLMLAAPLIGCGPGSAKEAVPSLNPDAPELIYRRGETPLPQSRRFTSRQSTLSVDLSEADSKLSLVFAVDGQTIFETRDDEEQLEEIYVAQMVVGGPGELVVATRRHCKELRVRLITVRDGQWQVVIDRADLAHGYLKVLDYNRFLVVVPVEGSESEEHIRLDYLDQHGGWNDYYSTFAPAGGPPPAIPGC